MADEEGDAAPEPEPEPEPEEMPPPIGMAWTDLSPEDVDIYVSTKDLDEKLKYVVQERHAAGGLFAVVGFCVDCWKAPPV